MLSPPLPYRGFITDFPYFFMKLFTSVFDLVIIVSGIIFLCASIEIFSGAFLIPFGLLIMFAIFNRFDKSYEEASRDLGATSWQTFKYIVLPIIAPSVIGIALFGFTLSYDELARSSQVMGATNTLPLELKGLTTTVTTPVIYALGTLTTGISFLVIFIAICSFFIIKRKKVR